MQNTHVPVTIEVKLEGDTLTVSVETRDKISVGDKKLDISKLSIMLDDLKRGSVATIDGLSSTFTAS